MKKNKSGRHDEASFHVVKNGFVELINSIKHIFELSLSQAIFLEKMKIAETTPIFKTNEATLAENYRPISVLPYFSKILAKMIYNRLYKSLVIWTLHGACHYPTGGSITYFF